ncbi:MAG: IS30 family transposase [Candidatus Omnitrophica bacterium]|nr:IS30 family transposase [Candidatus Omnitrophota bacterium]MCB9747956.1 IS30 family transposase [Candidatus Omnitrophota bacterium]
MEPNNNSTKKKKFTHLKESERYKIEVWLEEKKSLEEIAKKLGRARSTIYREIKRGSLMRLHWDLSEKKQYRADVAQRDYHKKAKNKGRELKIGKDQRLEDHIRRKILKERYSPDAVIGEIKAQGLIFEGMICTKTLYNYIEEGIFSGISNENLWEKRKRRKKRYKTLLRISRTNRLAKSIEQRPQEANLRSEYGHWEGDCIKGPKKRTTSLFTLTERKTLEQIIIKIERSSQEEIHNALNNLEKKLKDRFRIKFKSITFDNGVEFLDWQSLELSIRNPKNKRTNIYFAHAYAAWERGSNEVQNKMIRRFIPKGTDIHRVSENQIQNIQNWMNNYPRKKLAYRSANQLAKIYSQINNN